MVEFMALWDIIHSSQFCVIGKLAEGTFCPIIQSFNEDVTGLEALLTQWYFSSYWSPSRLHATDHKPLDTVIRPVFYLPHCLLIQLIFHCFSVRILWET